MKKIMLLIISVTTVIITMLAVADAAFADTTYVEDTNIKWTDGVTGGAIYFDAETGTITGCTDQVTQINLSSEIKGVKVVSLGKRAFADCGRLEKITIPNTIDKIEKDAFIQCERMKEIFVDEGNKSYRSIEGVLYDKATRSLICCPNAREEINIPDSVTIIGENAFAGCKHLEEIRLPESIKSLGIAAFKQCESLKAIDIPPNVTDIKAGTFQGCISLEQISLQGEIKHIYSAAFAECKALTQIKIPDSAEEIGPSAFYSCSSIRYIDLPEGMKMISPGTFAECSNLEIIKISKSVKSIWNGAFNGCDSLQLIISEKGAYAEQYAKENGYAFKTINEYFSSQVPKNQYGIFVYDSEGNPVQGAKVTFGENSPLLTDGSGLALFDGLTKETPLIKVTCDGYMPWSNKDLDYTKSSNRYDIVRLNRAEDSGLAMEKVLYNSGKKDLLKNTQKITLPANDQKMNETIFTLECYAKDVKKVNKYEIWQNNKKIAVAQPNAEGGGVFSGMKSVNFKKGKGCAIIAYDTRGNRCVTPINLVFEKSTVPEKIELNFESDKGTFEVTLSKNMPIVGGSKIKLDKLPAKFPIRVKIKDDTVYFTYNILPEANLLQEATELSEIQENRLAEWNDAIRTENGEKIREILGGNATLKTKDSFTMRTAIYGTAKLKELEKLDSIEVGMYVLVEGKFGVGVDFIAIVVPCTVQLDFKASAKANAKMKMDFAKNSFTGELALTTGLGIEIYGGIGEGKIFSAGVYGSAKGEMEIIVLSNMEASGIKRVDATLQAGVKAYVAYQEFEHAFYNKTYNIYTRTNSPQMLMMHASETGAFEMDMYNAANYSLQDVSYLEDESEWLGLYRPMMLRAARNGQEGIQIYDLITTTYENAQPSVASNQEKMVMAYLRGDTSRSVYNMTQVMYSVYDAQTGTWKEPKALDEMDITGDYAPRLYSDGTDIYLVYQDCNTTFDEESGADMGNFAKAQVIKIARFDNDTETFVDITSLSEESLENDCYNTDAVFGLVEGTPTVAWISNPNLSDVFRQNNTNAIQCSKFENGQWQKAETLVSNEGCITEVAVGDDGIAYVMDIDNQLNTTDDRVLKLVQNNGVVSVAEGKVYGLSYTQLPGSENEKLTWMSKEGLKKYEGEALNIADNLTVASGYQVIDNDIYYVMSEGNQANLYKRVYDVNTQTWAEPVQLTESERYVEALTITKFGDDVFATLLNTGLTTEGEAVNRNCNLAWTKLNEVTDLAIISAEYESEQVKPGAELPIQIKIKNNGTTKIEKVNVTIKDTDGTAAYSNVQDVLLASGEEGFVEAQITMPETIAQTNYTVTVTTEKADKNFADNEATFTVGYTDLSAGYEQAQIGDKQFLYMTVTNGSYVPSGGKLEVKYGEEVTFETEIEELINGESTTVAVGLSDIMLSNGSSGTISVNVTADKEETSLYNNQELVYMDMDYQISYFANIKNNEEAFYEAVKVYDEALAVTEACPTRKGYRLIGWSTDRKASEPEYRIGDSITTNQALTLYGVWEENTGKSGILYGDVDENFKIDATDVLWIERYLAAWEPYAGLNKETADLNEDGMIDLKDVTILERYLAKWKGYGVLPLAI